MARRISRRSAPVALASIVTSNSPAAGSSISPSALAIVRSFALPAARSSRNFATRSGVGAAGSNPASRSRASLMSSSFFGFATSIFPGSRPRFEIVQSHREAIRHFAKLSRFWRVIAMKNLEAKFKLDDLARAKKQAEAIGYGYQATLLQRDTFFRVSEGKLKLREEESGAWLIFYGRADSQHLKLSSYEIVPVAEPAKLRAIMASALG